MSSFMNKNNFRYRLVSVPKRIVSYSGHKQTIKTNLILVKSQSFRREESFISLLDGQGKITVEDLHIPLNPAANIAQIQKRDDMVA